MSLDEYKATIDSRIASLQQTVDQDLAAAKRGVPCGERLDKAAHAIACLQLVRSELDQIDWMQL